MTSGRLRRTSVLFVATLAFGVACSGDGGREGAGTPTAHRRERSGGATVRVVGERAVAVADTLTVPHLTSRASSSPRRAGRSAGLRTAASAGVVTTPAGTLPNLRPVIHADDTRAGFADSGPIDRRHMLRFTVDSVNAGDHPIEIKSLPKDASTDEDAAQCVVWDGRLCAQYEPVGEVYFHQEHVHWHFKDYARYELRRVENGHIVRGPGGVMVNGGKVSFCLMDTFGPDVTPEEAASNPWLVVPVYNTCNPFVQGISPKWTDRYEWNLPGQSLELDGVPDGTYALLVTLNPSRVLFETNYDDNTTTQVVNIGTDTAGDRTVEVVNPPPKR